MMITKPNEKQQEVLDCHDSRIAVVALPGSGKTYLLSQKVEQYGLEHPGDHMVAITFTKKAAAELKNRIKLITNELEVSTIHSWCYRQLGKLAARYSFRVTLLEEPAVKDILQSICRKMKQYYVNMFQLYSYVMGNYNIDVLESTKKVFERIQKKYIEVKRQAGLYDFTDLPLYLYDKLTEYRERIDDVDALFVDEFQDVDEIQYKLFELVDCSTRFYIGDEAQSIYIFRNCLQDAFGRLENFTILPLDTNYRSYQEILDFAVTCREEGLRCLEDKTFYEFIHQDYLDSSDYKCDRGYGGIVCSINGLGRCFNLVDSEPADDILTFKSFLLDKDTQILCRANSQVKKLQNYGLKNVSTIHQAKGLEYKNVILIGFPITSLEELNIMYVGMTRAENQLLVADYQTVNYILSTEQIEIATTTKQLF